MQRFCHRNIYRLTLCQCCCCWWRCWPLLQMLLHIFVIVCWDCSLLCVRLIKLKQFKELTTVNTDNRFICQTWIITHAEWQLCVNWEGKFSVVEQNSRMNRKYRMRKIPTTTRNNNKFARSQTEANKTVFIHIVTKWFSCIFKPRSSLQHTENILNACTLTMKFESSVWYEWKQPIWNSWVASQRVQPISQLVVHRNTVNCLAVLFFHMQRHTQISKQ